MKLRFVAFPFVCAASVAVASADIFVMKDGSKLEGKILSQTDTHYELEVRIGKSIRDEKTVAKADVAEILEEKMDEKEFPEIAKLVPVPDLSNADEYARRMAAVSKFLAAHGNSPKAAEAKTILETLKTEAEAIAAGGMKVDGKIVSAEDYKADMYDIDAKIMEKRIRMVAASGDIYGALRGMGRMDLDFRLTNSRKALQPLTKQLVQIYKEQISEQAATYEKRAAERETSLARMSADARAASEAALEEEIAAARVRFKADQDAKQMWSFTHPYLPESLEEAMDSIKDFESGEQEDEEVDESKDAGRIYRNVLKFIANNTDPLAIEDAISQGYDAKIPDKYIQVLRDTAIAKGVQF